MDVKKPIDFQIGFSDSQITSFESAENDLFIFVLAWNAKLLKFKFIENIFFFISNSWNISDVYQVNNSVLFERALKVIYGEIPSQHPYKLIQFFDLDDNVVVEVGCKELIITIAELTH